MRKWQQRFECSFRANGKCAQLFFFQYTRSQTRIAINGISSWSFSVSGCVCVCECGWSGVSAHWCENVFHIIYLFASFRSAQIDRWLRCVFYRGTGKWKKSHFTQTGARCSCCYCQYKSFCCISDNVNSDWYQHLYPRSTIQFTFALDQVSVYLCGCVCLSVGVCGGNSTSEIAHANGTSVGTGIFQIKCSKINF